MKLVKIYRRYTFITLGLAIFLGGFFFYNIITYFVHQSDDHTLLEFQQNLEQYINETGEIPENNLLNKGRITHRFVSPEIIIKPTFTDTIIYSHFKQENVVYSTLSYTLETSQGNVLITLWQTSMDTEDILSAVLISLLCFFLLFALFSLWWNRWFMRRLWRPFYQILYQLNKVDLSGKNLIEADECNVDEFNQLIHVTNGMLQRIHDDFTTLQGLTETTSHELQTPLSIIKAKLEIIQQDANNSKNQLEQIKTLEVAVDRLARLNRFLLMIARINNNQFPADNTLILNKYVDEFLDSFIDFIELKNITVYKHYMNNFILTIHPQLAEMLISNLLSNAIRYNIKGGTLKIYIAENSIRIVNTYGNIIPSGNLFARFNKSAGEKDSTGLGLSIVDSICKKNGLHIKIEINETEFSADINR